jgi:hypothetical protein
MHSWLQPPFTTTAPTPFAQSCSHVHLCVPVCRSLVGQWLTQTLPSVPCRYIHVAIMIFVGFGFLMTL